MAPTQSKVWKYYQKVNNKEVKCNLCGKQLKYCQNTTNMLQHLKLKHAKEFAHLKTPITCIEDSEDEEEVVASTSTAQDPKPVQTQPKIQTTFANVNSFALGGSKHDEITNIIMEFSI